MTEPVTPFEKVLHRLREDNLLGARFALNVLIATAITWGCLRAVSDANPIWAIASMIASSDPVWVNAKRTFRGRTMNAGVGCAIGLVSLLLGGPKEWTMPVALAIAVLLSIYVVRVQVMWRQAPITAAIVIASGVTHQSKVIGIEHGLQKVAEVIFGCLVGIGVSWSMSRVWPVVPPAAPRT